MNHRFLVSLAAFLVCTTSLFAQGERKDKTAVTDEEIYDEPYSVNKLFVGIQPLYGELFVANVNAGFGAEAAYYLRDKADFLAHFRKTYSERFFDFSRDLANRQGSVDNNIHVFNYFELGGTYHVKDFEESSKTKMFLYKKSYKGDKWAARVPLSADVPCKVRKIYGVRLGGFIWDSSTDVNRALEAQDLTFADLPSKSGENVIPDQEMGKNGKMQDVRLFTNSSSAAVYVGGSMSWIKNVAVNFDKFEEGIDDLIFTAYFDILVAPSIKIYDIYYSEQNAITGVKENQDFYAIDALKTKTFGFRAG